MGMLLNDSGNTMLNWTIIEANISALNQSSIDPQYIMPVSIIISLLVIILLLNLFGNSVVVLVIIKKRRMRTFTNCLILNLAVADLTVALICIPLEIPLELNNFKWIYGDAFCTIFYPLQTVTIFASAFTLVVLSCSRYWAIVHPFKKQPNILAAKVSIFIIWVSSLMMVIPFMLSLNFVQERESCEEVWNPSARHAYTIAAFLVQCALPLILIIITSSRIMYEMSSKKSCLYKDKKREEESKKLSKLFVAISATFAFCSLPTHIITIFVEFDNGANFRYIEEITIAAYILLYSNSALNPILYNVLSSSFRSGLVEIIRLLFNFSDRAFDHNIETSNSNVSHAEMRIVRDSANDSRSWNDDGELVHLRN